jgi:uncharacterized LabA/DUF88 family protein
MQTISSSPNLAVFIDFENLALGFPSGSKRIFKVDLVLDRLLEKGKVIAKIAYADWSKFSKYKKELHEAGVELIEIPQRRLTGKNSADIRLVVDAMELCHTKQHVDTFVIVSGDSDFSPLVSKLKENGRHVIGLGMKASTSSLLADNCDEFIYYEELEEPAPSKKTPARGSSYPPEKREAWELLLGTANALLREGHDVLHASLIKDTMKRKRPSFSESSFGYESFGDLLEDLRDNDLLDLREDERSGTWVVSKIKRRRRGSRGRRGGAKKKG